MAVQSDLESTVLKHNVSSRDAYIESSLAAKVPNFFYKLLTRVKLALEIVLDVALESAWIVIHDRDLLDRARRYSVKRG